MSIPAFLNFDLHKLYFSTFQFSVCVFLYIWSESLIGSIYVGLVFLSLQLPYVGQFLNFLRFNLFNNVSLSVFSTAHPPYSQLLFCVRVAKLEFYLLCI